MATIGATAVANNGGVRNDRTLIQASHVVAREFTAVFAEVGLTPTQFGVLVQLEDREPRTQADLARGCCCARGAWASWSSRFSRAAWWAATVRVGWTTRRDPAHRGRSGADTLDELRHRVRAALGGPAGAEGEAARDDG